MVHDFLSLLSSGFSSFNFCRADGRHSEWVKEMGRFANSKLPISENTAL